MEKEIQQKIEECLNCKNKPCSVNGCPVHTDIPGFIQKMKQGDLEGAYYLLQDNTVTPDSNNVGRILPTQTTYMSWDETEAIKEGYTMQEKAESELCGNIYNHCILYKLAKQQTMVKCKNFKYGDKVTIIYEDREYKSIFTGLKYNMKEPYYTCVFGKTRIDFTDRMKIYNDRRYRKKR